MQCKDQYEHHDLMMMMMMKIRMQTYENHHHGYGDGSIQSILQQLRSLRDRINEYIVGINNYQALMMMAEPTNLQQNEERSMASGSTSSSRDDYLHYHHQSSSYGQDHGHGHEHMVIIPTWRPQRGLPARSVTVLRAWLFDHFLHP